VFEGEFHLGLMHGSGIYRFSNGDEIVGTWRNDVQHGLAVFRGADGSLREEQWEAGERMSSRPIGSADPLAISAELDAERVRQKVAQDTAQWHLIKKTAASEHGGLSTVSPQIAPPPPGCAVPHPQPVAHPLPPPQPTLPPARAHTPAEILEQLAANRAGGAAASASGAASSSKAASAAAPSPPAGSGSGSTVPAHGDTPSPDPATAGSSGSSLSQTSPEHLKTPSLATTAAHHAQTSHDAIEHVDIDDISKELVDVE